METKYILVSGGVLSGVGKGVVLSSIGKVLQQSGIRVTCIKIDPYLNSDAGYLSPMEHGEVFVLDDGSEVDLDFGNYERFLNISLQGKNSITAGKVYKSVLDAERRGEYQGKTVQTVPHITDEIQRRIKDAADTDTDICLIELGGTVGDIESMAFVEALRQFKKQNALCIVHVTYIPFLGEHKTKPTQHSVINMRSTGLEPDILICRSTEKLSSLAKEKLERFSCTSVVGLEDCDDIHSIPDLLEHENVGKIVCEILKIPLNEYLKPKPMKPIEQKSIKVCLVGKYTHSDAYLSLRNAMIHATDAIGLSVEFIENYENADGLVVCGGFGARGMTEKIKACTYARNIKKPLLGICLGMQVMVVEYCRNVLNLQDANSEEFDPESKNLVVRILSDRQMHLGSKNIHLKTGSKAYEAYGTELISERHRHKYFVDGTTNMKSLKVTGVCDNIAEIIELEDHPFYVGVQYHPEYKSRREIPSAIISRFIKSSSEKAF